MLPGFKTRLLQELTHLLGSLKEFEEIRACAGLFAINDSCIPPNCLAWAGASILACLNSEIDKFEVTAKDYNEKFNQEYIPDRYGEAFLFGTREENYFNKDFEEYFKYQKQIIFSSTTPYSTRSYASRRDGINAGI